MSFKEILILASLVSPCAIPLILYYFITYSKNSLAAKMFNILKMIFSFLLSVASAFGISFGSMAVIYNLGVIANWNTSDGMSQGFFLLAIGILFFSIFIFIASFLPIISYCKKKLNMKSFLIYTISVLLISFLINGIYIFGYFYIESEMTMNAFLGAATIIILLSLLLYIITEKTTQEEVSDENAIEEDKEG